MIPDRSARLSSLEAAHESLRAAEYQRAAAAAFQQSQPPTALEMLLTQQHDLLARMVMAIESLAVNQALLTELLGRTPRQP